MVDLCCVFIYQGERDQEKGRETEEQGKDCGQIDLITRLIDRFEFRVATLIYISIKD
jgi:hypothetical protein